jgi:peptidoglycan/LPS O-acetylase OafA/YrhL
MRPPPEVTPHAPGTGLSQATSGTTEIVPASGDRITASWGHYPALDGLRTVAVFLVLLFHCGVAGFDGGFVGVDLFFVLSGFLVSSILIDEAERTGHIRIGRFYGRRVRRLLPAAIAVVVATGAVELLLSSLVARLPWVGDAQASLLYVSNWRFLAQSNDYMAADIDKSPFLHFWSLSIEEQFYVAFPLLLLLLFKLRKRWQPAVVTGVAVLAGLSVVCQVFWSSHDSNHAYYGTDARIYQLLVGVIAAIAWRRYQDRARRAPTVGWASLAIVVLTASSLAPFSVSGRGLVAAFASVVLILAVVAGADRSLVHALSRPTMTYLGRISYGIYLWHWPVILCIRVLMDVQPWVLMVLAAGVSTGLASASYQLLETPIRRSRRLAPFGFSTLVVGVTCSALVAFTLVPTLLERDRLPEIRAARADIRGTAANSDRLVPRNINWQKYRNEIGAGTHLCTSDDETSCVENHGSTGLNVAVIGDSHARQLASAMIPLSKEHDFTLSLDVTGGCPWQLGVISPKKTEGGAEACATERKELYGSVLKDMGVNVVVLLQNARERPEQILAEDGSEISVADLVKLQGKTVDEIRSQGIKVVIVQSFLRISGKGDDYFNPLECLAAAKRVSECRVPVPTEPPIFDGYYRLLALKDPADVATIDINPVMCPAWPVCEALDGRIPVWRDGGHYSADDLVKHRAEIWALLHGSGFFDRAS